MFDRIIPSPSPKRWRTFLIIATAGGHAAVLSALVLVAFWRIDKLPVTDDRRINVSVSSQESAAASPPAGEKLTVKRPTVVPKVPVQPVLDPPPPAIDKGGATGNGLTPGGNGDNPDGTPDGDGACVGPQCGACPAPPCDIAPEPQPDPPPVAAVPPPPVKVEIVPPDVAAGLRIAGNEKIYPPDAVRVAMVHAGQDVVQATIKVCVDTAGGVSSVKLLRSTGHGAYDSKLVGEMRAWRYRPYRVNGVAAPMCTVQVVIYRMKN